MEKLTSNEFDKKVRSNELILISFPKDIDNFIRVVRQNVVPPIIHTLIDKQSYVIYGVVGVEENVYDKLLYYDEINENVLLLERDELQQLHNEGKILSDFTKLYANDEEAIEIANQYDIPFKLYVGKLEDVQKIKNSISNEEIRNKINIVTLAFVSEFRNAAVYVIKDVPELKSGIFSFNIDELKKLINDDLVIDYNELIK